MESFVTKLVILLLAITLYWSVRGIIQMFQRYNAILVVFYFVLLFPIAYLHAFILGIFGSSKKQRLKKEVAARVKAEKMYQEQMKDDNF